MKSLVLASVLGSAVGVAVVPALGGPVHYQITRAHSLFGMLTAAAAATASVSLGQLPLDFVLTDVIVDGLWSEVYVTVNGANVAALRVSASGSLFVESLHLNSGIYIPAGSTIGVQGVGSMGNQSKGVTVSGYVQ
jgi:hypothetical protein